MVRLAHANASEKGFWDAEKRVLEKIHQSEDFDILDYKAVQEAFMSQKLMLIVSELSEALEAMRENDTANFKKELADVVIRTGDTAGGYDIDLHMEVIQKMSENSKRPPKHGKEF